MSKRFNVDWDAIGLGERNDCEIADEVGCTRFAVLQQRRKRGIASCDHRRQLREVESAIVADKAEREAEK